VRRTEHALSQGPRATAAATTPRRAERVGTHRPAAGPARPAVSPTERRALGRSGLSVSVLGFGGNALGNLYTALDTSEALAAVAAAHEAGVAYYDTAPLYGHGLSERRMGDALRGMPRDGFVLSTKVGRLLHPYGRTPPPRLSVRAGGIYTAELPFLPTFDYSYDATIRSFEDSLQRLGMDRIDVLLIHDCDAWSHGRRYPDVLRMVEHETMPALQQLRAKGSIGAIGAGVNQAEACERLMDIGAFDCFMIAGRYTLLDQTALDGLLWRAFESGVSVLAAAPFNSGILATGAVEGARYRYEPAPRKILERVARIEAICRRHDVPLAAAALQFALGHPAVASVVPGSRSPAESVQQAAWMSTPIPVGFWRDLQAERLVRADAPIPGA
jgi:D-threo-aldose 1-dehydrogenase